MPVLHPLSLAGERHTNSDIVTGVRKELEGSEITGMSTDISIFQTPSMGAAVRFLL